MKFEEFVEEVKKDVSHKIGSDYRVTINSVLKVNRELHGISVSLVNATIMPSLYLEEFYAEYIGGKEIDQISKEIIEVSQHKRVGADQLSIHMTDFEWVRPRLRAKLINRSRNVKLLQTIPHEEILDLAIIPYVLILDGEKIATAMVRLPLMDQWNITPIELLAIAKTNTIQNEPVLIEPMADFILTRFMKELDEHSEIEDEQELFLRNISESQPNDTDAMYIISNQRNINGAFVALQPEQLAKLARRIGTDKLYILPSSVHEILALPVSDIPVEHLKAMVKEVNLTTVSEDEYLSDEVYLFDGSFEIA